MVRRAGIALAVVGGLGVAFHAGRLSRPTAPGPVIDPAVLEELRAQGAHLRALSAKVDGLPRAAGSSANGCDAATLRAGIHTALDEELGARAVGDHDRGAERLFDPSPESIAAFDAANRLLDDALTRGRWRPANAEDLRRLLPGLMRDQRDAVLGRLFPAINNQEIVLETDGPPF